jgi:hypothetical protein
MGYVFSITLGTTADTKPSNILPVVEGQNYCEAAITIQEKLNN